MAKNELDGIACLFQLSEMEKHAYVLSRVNFNLLYI